MIRNEIDALTTVGIPVFGSNTTKVYPLPTDPEYAPWNDLEQNPILEIQQENGQKIKIGLIGIIEPDLVQTVDEVQVSDPVACYDKAIEKLKRKKCDLNIVIFYGNVESDESQEEIYSLRRFLRQITDVDLILVSHGAGDGVRVGYDGRGIAVPIISLPDGTESALKLSLAKRDNGKLIFDIKHYDMRQYAPDEDMKKQIQSYVTAMSEIMDERIGTLNQKIEPYAPNAAVMTDGMELIHEMQIWSAKQWIESSGQDLPPNMISIAYPYLGTSGWNEGPVRYRDLCALNAQTPRYTLMMIRGAELRAWLSDYAGRIMEEQHVYSLYGLSYLLNTMNAQRPLGYLEFSSGVEVDDDEVFTLLLADDPEEETILRPYLDESWMTYEDRVISDFRMPRPKRTETSEVFQAVDPMVAFFEEIGEFTLKHETGWYVI